MILDTDILIDLMRQHLAATAWFALLTQMPFACGFAAIELLSGSRDRAEERRVRRFLAQFPILWPSEAGLKVALDQYAALYRTSGLGPMDALIAATATEHGLELATFNKRHFQAVPGLVTVQPYTH